MKKLILKNSQSPGDIVMLTAAVRDLHRSNPGYFITDTRTPCSHLWENNPYITPLCDTDPEAELEECEYPLIRRSNSEPWHSIHGFSQFLAARLGARVGGGALKQKAFDWGEKVLKVVEFKEA